MNPDEFEQMLSFIAFECVLKEENLKMYLRLNINPIDWPSFAIKQPFIAFLSTWETNGHHVAQLSHARDIMPFKRDCFTIEQIKLNYPSEILKIKANRLATDLLNNPLKLDEILARFKQNRPNSVTLTPIVEAIDRAIIKQVEKCKNGSPMRILPGFPKLSKAITGFDGGCLTIISGRSGFGKTKLAINLADSASDIMPTSYYNMEMIMDQFVAQLIHKRAKIRNTDWADGSFLTKDNLKLLESLNEELSHKQFKISDGRTLSKIDLLNSIYAEAEFEPHFIIVDYDQKVSMDYQKQEWQEILSLVTDLESAAKETNSHIILLAQANDVGNVRSSVRALQPATNLLTFTKDDLGRSVIKSIKTRHQAAFTLEMDYKPAICSVTELDFVKDEPKDIKPTFNHYTQRK